MDVEETYEAYGDELFLYLARYCGDPQLARDVVQETFVRLHGRPPERTEAIRRWLFRTATNLLRDMLRVASNRRRILRSESHRIPKPGPTSDPQGDLERREDLARLRRVLSGLREKERTALLMREAGFKHREIAEELGTTTASVGTLIARSLAKLESAMRGEEGSRS